MRADLLPSKQAGVNNQKASRDQWQQKPIATNTGTIRDHVGEEKIVRMPGKNTELRRHKSSENFHKRRPEQGASSRVLSSTKSQETKTDL